MSDPLGLIQSTGSAGAPGFPCSAPAPRLEPGQPSFKDVMLKTIQQVGDLQQDATQQIEDLATGRTTSIESVMIATQKADIAFNMLQAVRNKVVAAYEEIKQMRV